MKLVRAQAPDGTVFRAVNGSFHVTKAAGDPKYYRDFNRAPLMGGSAPELRNPYAESVWVQAAIGAVTQPIKSVSLKFYSGDNEFTEPDFLAWWKFPTSNLSLVGFIDALGGWYKLAGEFFIVLPEEWIGRGRVIRAPRPLIVRPDRMKAVMLDGALIGWEVRDDKGRRFPLIPEQVIHEKRWNPLNDTRGLSELRSAEIAAETDWLAGKFAHDTYAAQGEQGDYIVAKGGDPTDAQRLQIIAGLRERQLARQRGERVPGFFTGDIEVKSPTVTAPDAAFVANRLQSRHEIFVAFGVPASMADVQASYSIGSASDYFRLIHGTSMPLAKTICAALSRVASRLAGRELEAEFDWDEHPTMQAIRAERINSAKELFAMGIPMQKINDYLDMGLAPFPGWEKGYLPFSVSEVAATTTPPAAPTPAPVPDPVGPVQEMIRALECGCTSKSSAPKCERSPDRESLWQKHMQARRATERAYESKWSRAVNDARRETLAKLEAAAAGKTKAVAADLTFDLEEWKKGFQASMRKVGLTGITAAVSGLLDEISLADDVWSMPPAKALEFLASRDNFLSDIADEVHARIEGAIQQGLVEGDSIKDIAAKIREEFNGISRERATVIAQTETAAAYGFARDEAMRGTGVKFKQWLTSGNYDTVRPTHLAAERQTVGIDEPFQIGGYPMNYPGDGTLGAPPEEIINCRCVQIALLEAPTDPAV